MSTTAPTRVHALTNGVEPAIVAASSQELITTPNGGLIRRGYASDAAVEQAHKDGWFGICLSAGDNYVWAREASAEFPATHAYLPGPFGHSWKCVA